MVMIAIALVACTGGGTQSAGSGGDDGGGGDESGDDAPPVTTSGGGAIIADHNVIISFEDIPGEYIDQAITSFHIFYGHTSHGSQLLTGLDMLQSAVYDNSSLDKHEDGSDLGNPAGEWPTTTRTHLDAAGNNFNIVMWSWCGQVSGMSSAEITEYLNNMNQLESEYPDVAFVYMTGHTDGSGDSGTLRTNNRQIREYCRTNDKVLFDFEDIESWDPGGAYYPDTDDACGWCGAWCGAHSCPACGGCAHSHCFNCYLKGKAVWWMLARLAGWDGN